MSESVVSATRTHNWADDDDDDMPILTPAYSGVPASSPSPALERTPSDETKEDQSRPRFARTNSNRPPRDTRDRQRSFPTEPPFKAYVTQFAVDTTDDELNTFMSTYGPTTEVQMLPPSNQSGRCVVTFSTLDGLKAAVEKTGTDFKGRAISIQVEVANYNPKQYTNRNKKDDFRRPQNSRGGFEHFNRSNRDLPLQRAQSESNNPNGMALTRTNSNKPDDSSRDFGRNSYTRGGARRNHTSTRPSNTKQVNKPEQDDDGFTSTTSYNKLKQSQSRDSGLQAEKPQPKDVPQGVIPKPAGKFSALFDDE